MRQRTTTFIRIGAAAISATAILAPCGACGADCGDAVFTTVGSDVVPRFFHAASVLPDGTVLVSGGMRVQLIPPALISLSDLSFHDPTSATYAASWEPTGGGPAVTPALAVPRSAHTQTTLLDGRVLFTGGRTGAAGTSPGTAISSVELFDPVSGATSFGPPMSAPRAKHTATLLPDGRVVVAGGADWQVFTAGSSDGWSVPFAATRSRTAHAAVLLPDQLGPGGHAVLLIGGAGNGGATMELLDPDGRAGIPLAATLAVPVDDLAARRLDDGVVLIVGGQDLGTGDTVACSYLYDPVLDEITEIDAPPDLSGGLADHALVTHGAVALVIGGEQQASGTDTILRYAAVYDRAADFWLRVDDMNALHDDFATAGLVDERVLIVDGGVPFLGQEIASVANEVFAWRALRPFDLDDDGMVGFSDLVMLLGAWGPCPRAAWCAADLNFTGAVGFEDLVALLAEWGMCE